MDRTYFSFRSSRGAHGKFTEFFHEKTMAGWTKDLVNSPVFSVNSFIVVGHMLLEFKPNVGIYSIHGAFGWML